MALGFESLSVYGKVYAIDTPGHGAHSVVGPAAAYICLSTASGVRVLCHCKASVVWAVQTKRLVWGALPA